MLCCPAGNIANSSIRSINPMETDKRVAPPIPFAYWFGLQNLRHHMCCRAIKTKLIGVAVIAYQCPFAPNDATQDRKNIWQCSISQSTRFSLKWHNYFMKHIWRLWFNRQQPRDSYLLLHFPPKWIEKGHLSKCKQSKGVGPWWGSVTGLTRHDITTGQQKTK